MKDNYSTDKFTSIKQYKIIYFLASLTTIGPNNFKLYFLNKEL